MHRRAAALAAAIFTLYLANRFWLLPRLTGLPRRLMAGHFADFLAGAGMLLLLCWLLAASGRRPPLTPLPALGFCLLCGLFWECVTPLYLPRSVGDGWDVLACVAGGAAVLPLLRNIFRSL